MFEQYEKNKKNLKQIIFLFNIKIKVIAAAFLTRKKKKKNYESGWCHELNG